MNILFLLPNLFWKYCTFDQQAYLSVRKLSDEIVDSDRRPHEVNSADTFCIGSFPLSDLTIGIKIRALGFFLSYWNPP